MFQKTYFMPKSTGTFADTLAAYGLAAVLSEIVERADKRWSGQKVWIRDAGPYYTIELPTELREEWVDQCEFFSLAKPIRTRGQPVKQVKDAMDLDAAWDRFREFRELQDKLKKTLKGESADSELQAQLDEKRPNPEFWTMAFVGERKMQAIQIYNAAIVQWHTTRKHFTENLKTILKLAATPDADVDQIAKEWSHAVPSKGLKLEFSASQLLNPIQGQGQNRPKANALNVRERPQSFWLLQFLKAVGLWKCMVPRTVRNGDDRKAYVLAPIALTLKAHKRIFRTFAERLWNDTSVKMDITASLLYTQALLEYSEAGQQDELDFEGRGPEDVVAGLHVATYKLLSRNAYTMMNLGFIGLPRWTGEVKTRARVKELKEVIKEHLDVIRTIEEERSDGYNLLVRYRDFLSGGQLETFFDFAIGYGQYLMGEWSKKNLKVRPFTPDNLRRLLMAKEPKLDEIIKVQGFRNLAAAIRHSTVIPQRRKAQGKETAYEPEYNLGMELKRVAPFKDKFVSALGAFIQSYNAETLRRMESPRQPQFRGKPMRPRVAEQDLDELLPLIDEYGPEVICNLLLAYGYAWEYRTKDEDTSESQDE
jgi:hypothetical protein